jgi:regulator of sigma E protease
VTQTPGFFWTVLSFIAVIGPLVFLHEMGHYLAGRWFGVKADVFSIGFGREIFGWSDRRGTRWKVGWLPLGGYVRFAGDMSPASEPSDAWKALAPEERSKTFQSKPLWQRAIIVAAGPIMNFLIAIFILGGFAAVYGDRQTPAVVVAVEKGSAAEKAGILAGDQIVRVAGRDIGHFEDIYSIVQDNPGQSMTVDLKRAGLARSIAIIPSTIREKDRFGNEYRFGRLGIQPPKPVIVPVPVAQLPGVAIARTGDLLGRMVDGIVQIVTGRRPIDELGGPLKIAQVAGQVSTLGWDAFVSLIALVSINLGFINLLPVPMLDGGHLTFYAIEAVRRKPVGPQAQEWAFRSGLAVLLAFMIFVTFHNDFRSLGIWDKLAGLIG